MPKLRKTILNFLTEIGNQSGCHQLPARSIFIKGWQLPVCARCTGVCIGQLASLIVGIIFKPISIRKSVLLISLMGIDWGVQEANIKKSTNTRRLITGILGGYGLFNIYVRAISKFYLAIKSIL